MMLVLGGYALDGATIIDSTERSKATPRRAARLMEPRRAEAKVVLN
jgi:hypothetical protein